MAKTIPFQVPEDLEYFTQNEADSILRIGKSTRMELIHRGTLVAINVGGNRLITGRSIRAYLAECAADPRPTGRSLSGRQFNDRINKLRVLA